MAVAIANTSARLSCDRKTAQVVRVQLRKQSAKPNTFGLPAGDSCPERTPFCDSCYADKLEQLYTAVERLMQSNFDALLACRGSVTKMVAVLTPLVVESVRAHDAAVEAGVLPADSSPIFRIHWNGDLFSLAYAKAWRSVIESFPDVQFWMYTRSFKFVRVFDPPLPNLALYLSVDEYNAERAAPLLARYNWLLAAGCATTHADARALLDGIGRRGVACPENTGALPLVVDMSGRRSVTPAVGDDAQGACAACGLCVFGRRDVTFATSKR